MSPSLNDAAVEALAAAHFAEQQRRNSLRMDRTFAVLMGVQWVAAVAVASLLTPWTYAGATRFIHPHLLQAVIGGGILSSLPIAMTRLFPAQPITRQVIAAAQMLWSALLIHITGGRIETHFHVFGSLAFLAFYRDWRVIPTATLVVATDHFLRGILAPMSVYGVVNPEWWRFLEHAGWVVFEDIVLLMSCVDGVKETRETALRRAQAEVLSESLERRVEERTHQLSLANGQLTAILERQQQTQQQLVLASRKAGMADVATSVLHNVGNVLNSVNVSAGVVADTVKRSKAAGVGKLAALLAQPEIGSQLEGHPKLKQVPTYVSQVAEAIGREQAALLTEIDGLQRNIEHIKVIVTKQQAHAKGGGSVDEDVRLDALLDEALTASDLHRPTAALKVARELDPVPAVRADRHKLFQIVVNLLTNARHAVTHNGREEGRITLRLRQEEGRVEIEVRDDGYGISPENLGRIFNHGFTTKAEGHGFGLHGSANTAREMGGQLRAASDGLGHGATFVLELPVKPALKVAA